MTYRLIILRFKESKMLIFIDNCINNLVDRAINLEHKYDIIFVLNNDK